MKQQRILTFEDVYDKLIDYLNNNIDHTTEVIAYYFYKLGVEHGKQLEDFRPYDK